MIAVNELVARAYESINMTGLGESTDGTMAEVGVNELNRAISTLNSEGYLALSQKWSDADSARVIYFRKLAEGEELPNSIDMEPPVAIVAVARKIGNRFLPLNNGNHVQMSQRTPQTTATSWTYDVDVEEYGEERYRSVGILTLDGNPHGTVRIWYNSQIPQYKLEDTIYMSDLYNELLMCALCVRLAKFYELSEEKKAELNTDLTTAKNLIKRNNATQRMQQSGNLMGSYQDSYYNGMSGYGF